MKAWPHGDPDAVVRGILASPAYRSAGPSTTAPLKPSVLSIVFHWLVDHVLRPIFGPLGRAVKASHGVGTVVGVIIIIIALTLLVVAIYRLVVAFARPLGSHQTSASGDRIALATALTSAQWRARARGFAGAGEYARAIAALFSAAIVTLDERSLVPFDATRTPGEYRRLVRRAWSAGSDSFDVLTAEFVRAAYAQTITTPQDFALAERACDAFVPAAGA